MNHSTIWMAIDLMQSPSNVKRVRAAPLPTDVSKLLRIAAGDEDVTREAVGATSRSHDTVREAAAFYIEQILLYPGADSYRVLGAHPDASLTELRRNMALLIRWLHPDQQKQPERSVFAARVTRAWNELKTEERRATYDQAKSLLRRQSAAQKRPSASSSSKRGKHSRRDAISRPHVGYQAHHPGFLKRVLSLLFGRVLH